MKALFLDFCTQKMFVENFGTKAIIDTPEIRENLMRITHMAITKEIPTISLLDQNENDPEMLEKCMDTEIDETVMLDTSKIEKYTSLKFKNISEIDLDAIKTVYEHFKRDTIFVYGLPLEGLIEFSLKLTEVFDKIWIVVDAVKSNNGNEREEIKKLKENGIKGLTTQSLEAYLNL